MNKTKLLLCNFMLSVCLFGCNSGGDSGNSSVPTTNSVNNKQNNSSLMATNEINNLGATANLQSVTYGKGVYVAVGDNGQIVTSYDAQNWIAQNSHTTMNLHAITFSDVLQQFYVVGDDGYVLSSADGINWNVRFPLNPSVALYSVMAVGNGLVFGGKDGVIFELTVGARGSETIVKRDVLGVGNITAMAYAGDKMLLATANGSIFAKSYTAWSSQNWSKIVRFGNYAINSLYYDQFDEMFIGANANGEVFLSVNGQDWSKPIKVSNNSINDLILDESSNNFTAVGGNLTNPVILTSNNFNTWDVTPSSLNQNIHSIKCFNAGEHCISVGDAGQIGYVAGRDPISQSILLTPAQAVKNNAVALLSEPDGTDYTNDRLFRIQIGTFGIKSYRVTNVTKNTNLTLQSVSLGDNPNIIYDYTRSTCFNGTGSPAKAIISLAYGDSCTIVYKYQPSLYQAASWFSSYVTFKDDNGNLVKSNIVETPYSSTN